MTGPDLSTERAYRAHKAKSWTRWLKPFVLKSEAHAEFSIEHGGISTPGRAFLNAIHCLALRPDDFDDDFAVCSIRRDKRTKAYQAFLSEAGARLIITDKENARAQHIAAAVRAHPKVKALLAHPECRTEQSLLWTDPVIGESKGRADICIPGVITADLKFYRSDDPQTVARDICANAWDSQLAWYEEGVAGHFDVDMSDAVRVTIIAVEHGGDYGARDDVPALVTVGWFEHSDAMKAVGNAKLEAAKHALARCLETGEWAQPTPADGVVVDPPRWAVIAAGLDPDEVFAPLALP